MRKILLIIFINFFYNCHAQRFDSVRLHTKVPGPIQVEPPRYSSTKTDLNDSTYLLVKLFQTGYCVYFLNDSLRSSDTLLIDQFISKRIHLINREKVFVTGDPNARYSNFRALKNIFKKYEIFRFRIATDADIH